MLVDVTAVVPVHNGAEYLGEALQSIFDQTAKPREIVVVDDGSTDATAEVAARFPGIMYLKQPQRGAAEARNAGAQRAAMPYLAFLDADDLWDAAKTERQLHRMGEAPAVDIVAGRMLNFQRGAGGDVVPIGEASDCHLLPVLLMRRQAFFQAGPLSASWRVGETIDWWARAMDCGLTHAGVSAVVYLRRVHRGNVGSAGRGAAREYLKVLHTVVKRRREGGGRTGRVSVCFDRVTGTALLISPPA